MCFIILFPCHLSLDSELFGCYENWLLGDITMREGCHDAAGDVAQEVWELCFPWWDMQMANWSTRNVFPEWYWNSSELITYLKINSKELDGNNTEKAVSYTSEVIFKEVLLKIPFSSCKNVRNWLPEPQQQVCKCVPT